MTRMLNETEGNYVRNYSGMQRLFLALGVAWFCVWSAVAALAFQRSQLSEHLMKVPMMEYYGYLIEHEQRSRRFFGFLEGSVPEDRYDTTEAVKFWEMEGRNSRRTIWIAAWAVLLPLLLAVPGWWIFRGFRPKASTASTSTDCT